MKKTIILLIFTIFLLSSCDMKKSNISVNEVENNNLEEWNYFNNRNIYFWDDEWNDYSITYDELNNSNIPQKISFMHIWHKLSSEEVKKIFSFNLNFIDSPDIIFANTQLSPDIHDIFTNLNIKKFKWLIQVYSSCREGIKANRTIYDKYINSKIEKFDIYTVCATDVSIPVWCYFEWDEFEESEELQNKFICG